MPLTGLGRRQESCSAALYFLGTSGYAFYQNFRLRTDSTETNPESVGVDDYKLWPYYMELKQTTLNMSWANPWTLSEAHIAKQPFLKGVISAACQCMASTNRVP